jgi:GNAT superfamily N-acetyltransferase
MISIRKAIHGDVPDIVRLLADDVLGQNREQVTEPLSHAYSQAFEAIDADPNQLLAVMTDGERVIGTLQLSFIPGLSRQGSKRGQIEAVRIAEDRRSERLGEKLIEWAIAQCRDRDCVLVQLTTDRRREDAHRFYERLGFKATHLGYKLDLHRTGSSGST